MNYVQNDPNSPKVEIINGQVVVDRGLNQLNDDIRLAIYDVQGRLILKQNCCSININNHNMVNGIYFLEIANLSKKVRAGIRISIQQ